MPDPVAAEYSRVAPHYDRRWSSYVAATTGATLARLSLRPARRVLDVGCGTGMLLAQLSQQHPASLLCGVDPVPEMLAVARRRLPGDVALREGWAEWLPYEDACFDIVVVCSVFHSLRHPVAALREIGRVLRTGGELVMTDWCRDYLSSRLRERLRRRVDPALFKTWSSAQWRELLEATGYPRPHIERYRIGWRWGLMTAKACKASLK